MPLNEREKYCLALIITNGGQTGYYKIRDTILECKESFGDLSERYLKYQAIKRTLHSLAKKGYLSEQKSQIFKINPIMEIGFVQQFPIMISKAIKSNLKYRKEHTLEFDTSEIERDLFDEEEMEDAPWELIANLKEALRLQRMGSYDSVLVKCGKCVEIMVNELDYDYSLFDKELTTGTMINKLRNGDAFDRMKDKVDMDNFRTFIDGISVVYRFRNTMGAHSGWAWGRDNQVAQSCLILTFYLADLYMWIIRKGEE